MPIAIADLPLIVAAFVASVAAATDLWRFKVYNALTLPSLALGLVAAGLVGGWPGLRLALLGAGLGFGVLLVLHAMGGVGAGDVKLLAALGAWLGPSWLYQVFAASALATGAYALALVAWGRGASGVVAELILARNALVDPGSLRRAGRPDLAAEIHRPDRRRRLVPFAAMTGVGFLAALLWNAGQPRGATPLAPTASRGGGSSLQPAGLRHRPAPFVAPSPTLIVRTTTNPEAAR